MRQSGPVQTTKEEREGIKETFLTIANGLFDEYSVHEHHPIAWSPKSQIHHPPRQLSSEDVKMTQVWSDDKSAHLAVKSDGHWTLGIKYKTWRTIAPLRKFSLLVHEAAHLPMNGFLFPRFQEYRDEFDFTMDSVEPKGNMSHAFPYWVTFATLGDRVDERSGMFDMPVSGGAAICKAIGQSRRYAQGVTGANDWVEGLFKVVNYEPELFEVFGRNGVGRQYELTYDSDEEHEEVEADNIWLDFPTDRELFDAVEDSITYYDSRGPRIQLQNPPTVTTTTYSDPDGYDYKAVNTTAVALRLRQLRPQVEVVID